MQLSFIHFFYFIHILLEANADELAFKLQQISLCFY